MSEPGCSTNQYLPHTFGPGVLGDDLGEEQTGEPVFRRWPLRAEERGEGSSILLAMLILVMEGPSIHTRGPARAGAQRAVLTSP